MADLVYEGNTPCTELQVATATAHPVPKSQTITGTFFLTLYKDPKSKMIKGKIQKACICWRPWELKPSRTAEHHWQNCDKSSTCVHSSVCVCGYDTALWLQSAKAWKTWLVFFLLFLCGFVSLFVFLALIKFLCLSIGQFSSLSRSILSTHPKLGFLSNA